MRLLFLFFAAFACMVLLIFSVQAAVAWWRGEAALTALDYVLACALPLLLGIWFRYFSMGGHCAMGACEPPEEGGGSARDSGA